MTWHISKLSYTPKSQSLVSDLVKQYIVNFLLFDHDYAMHPSVMVPV